MILIAQEPLLEVDFSETRPKGLMDPKLKHDLKVLIIWQLNMVKIVTCNTYKMALSKFMKVSGNYIL